MKPNQERPVIRLSSPPDIVGAIPFLIGFHPAESLVVICLHGPRNRTGFVMRVDLPGPRPGDSTGYVDQIAPRVVREGADCVIVTCYTEAPDEDGWLPRADLVGQLINELLLHEIGWMEQLLVRDGRWWSYSCTKRCCPPEGTPMPTSSSKMAELEAQRAMQGVAILPDRQTLEKSVSGPVAVRLFAFGQLVDEIGDRFAGDVLRRGLDAVRVDTLALARSAFESFAAGQRSLEDADAARILIGLSDKLARDVLVTWGLSERHQELIAFLTTLAQCAVDEVCAPVCTVLAAVAYQHGDGALASVALERALTNDPGYEFAQILDALLNGQVRPKEIRALARRTQQELCGMGIVDDEPSTAA